MARWVSVYTTKKKMIRPLPVILCSRPSSPPVTVFRIHLRAWKWFLQRLHYALHHHHHRLTRAFWTEPTTGKEMVFKLAGGMEMGGARLHLAIFSPKIKQKHSFYLASSFASPSSRCLVHFSFHSFFISFHFWLQMSSFSHKCCLDALFTAT